MDLYPFLLAAHVTAMVFLVGGMLFQNRMLAATQHYPPGLLATSLDTLFRIDRQIVTPALMLTWLFGLGLAFWAEWFPVAWLLLKLVFVIALSALHGIQSGRIRRAIRESRPAVSVPGSGTGIVLAMLCIAVLVIVKPF